ncbi:MAG: hypothetical protein M3R17_20610 [Bacteroidota bacterium]|nr:hypothetical protein [Bacteroidota bacterium]
MKKAGLFCALLLLLASVSCNMEKRLYRNGWYKEKNVREEFSPAQKNAPAAIEKEKYTGIQFNNPAPVEFFSSPDFIVPAIAPQKVKVLPEENEMCPGDTVRKKMTYREASNSIAKKGSKVHTSAMSIYNLSLISLWTSIFLVPGFVLAIITLSLAASAKKKVRATGDCVDENVDIIDAGKRIAWGVLTGTLIIGIVVLALWVILLAINSLPGS